MKTFLADLHVHTVLSPCADIEMIPPLIVEEALQRGINLIAITDHNASANTLAVQQAAEGTGLTVLPGMEVQTREEVHVLCLFDRPDQIEAWQNLISSALPAIENRADFFGDQLIVDATGDFIRREPQLLLTSTNLTFDEACQKVHDLGGIFVPAHVDRSGFGLFANLAFVPVGAQVDALELSGRIGLDQAYKNFPQLGGFPLIQDGDAHRLDELLGVNEFQIEAPTLSEIQLALSNRSGRSIQIKPRLS